MSATTPSPDVKSGQAEQYLTFTLGEERYGLEVQHVREIVALPPVTPIPRTPSFIRGVVNLRGHVVPVMDLRRKLLLPSIEPDSHTCVIVVSMHDCELGMIVDTVCDIVDFSSEEVESPSALGYSAESAMLRGIGKTGQWVTILLDANALLTREEIGKFGKYIEDAVEGEKAPSRAY